jgi:preprotein translocase subunit SecG
MEQNQQDSSLFGLNLDHNSKTHLAEAAKWARFLSIVGLIMCGLVLLRILITGATVSTMGYSRYDSDLRVDDSLAVTAVIITVVVIVLAMIPYIFLYRFASKMRAALASNDQETLNGSFQNLKVMFRYIGIFTIIFLSIMILLLLIGLASGAGGRF